MADGVVDQLSIVIDASGESAAAKIKSLSSALRGLKRSTKETAEVSEDLGTSLHEEQSGAADAEKKVGKLSTALSTLKQNAKKAAESLKKTGGSVGVLGNLLKSIGRIAFYRIIRSMIRAVTEAFTEGMKNAYAFSKSIQTEGHRFSVALDSMSTAGLKMKNQLGSAFISLMAAIMPLLLKFISLVTRAANALSQLFAAFTGGTYLKAIDYPIEWGDAAEGAAKAAKEWKNQILGFDEINRLEAPSTPSGGGSAIQQDPTQMFEDTEISEKYLRIAEKVKTAIQWVQDHLDLVRGIAIGIGVAIGTWKIAGIVTAVTGLAGGFNSVALAVMLVVGGIAALVVGFKQWIETGELTNDTLALICGGLLAVGAGLSILTGTWIPLAVAAAVAGLILVIARWHELKEKIDEWYEDFRDHMWNGKLEWQDFAYVFVFAAKSVIDVIDTIVTGIKTLIGWIKSAIKWLKDLGSISGNEGGGTFLSGFKPGEYASGGYPDTGQMFIARESGPEMVGTIGGQTAVATNGDIVQAVSRGVFEAVSAAMGSTRGGGGEVVLNINGREFARAVYDDQRAVARERGVNLVTG